jgi:hypothetical protein
MSTMRALPVHVAFNRSGFSQFINSPGGRVLRLAAGAAFLVAGYAARTRPAGVAAMIWSAVPLSAGALDLCYVSALLGGPISGSKIRALGQPRDEGSERRISP